MKKIIAVLLILVLALSLFAGCGPKETFEIAMITDKGDINDKSFNEITYKTSKDYAEANEKTFKYYKPLEDNHSARLDSIELAIKNGAKIVVCPGFLFDQSVSDAQKAYPDVRFVILDAEPIGGAAANTAAFGYSEQDSGYLAGYAAVKDGYKSLGFMGGVPVPAVKAYGHGYLQGIDDAAKELGITAVVKYHYTGNFDATDKNKSTTLAMMTGDKPAEIVFAAGGSVFKSVVAAANEQNKKTIGVDIDQSADDKSVVTSALKPLASSVNLALDAFYDGTFDAKFGGKLTTVETKDGGAGLPLKLIDDSDGFSRFTSFDKAQYDAVLGKIVDGTVKNIREIGDPKTAEDYIKGLGLTNVDLTLIA